MKQIVVVAVLALLLGACGLRIVRVGPNQARLQGAVTSSPQAVYAPLAYSGEKAKTGVVFGITVPGEEERRVICGVGIMNDCQSLTVGTQVTVKGNVVNAGPVLAQEVDS
jgi:hypothetical protein